MRATHAGLAALLLASVVGPAWAQGAQLPPPLEPRLPKAPAFSAGCTRDGSGTRHGEIPLANEIVRFP